MGKLVIKSWDLKKIGTVGKSWDLKEKIGEAVSHGI